MGCCGGLAGGFGGNNTCHSPCQPHTRRLGCMPPSCCPQKKASLCCPDPCGSCCKPMRCDACCCSYSKNCCPRPCCPDPCIRPSPKCFIPPPCCPPPCCKQMLLVVSPPICPPPCCPPIPCCPQCTPCGLSICQPSPGFGRGCGSC